MSFVGERASLLAGEETNRIRCTPLRIVAILLCIMVFFAGGALIATGQEQGNDAQWNGGLALVCLSFVAFACAYSCPWCRTIM